jgi:hypothetical protein
VGGPGIALLLLRAVTGIALLVQGRFYLSEPNPVPEMWFLGFAALVVGTLLGIGFLTPIAGTLGALGAVGLGLSLLPACAPALFDEKLPIILAASMLIAIVLLGPGAFSIDARMYGRREIIFPPSSSTARK